MGRKSKDDWLFILFVVLEALVVLVCAAENALHAR